jgi:hypothetical protein
MARKVLVDGDRCDLLDLLNGSFGFAIKEYSPQRRRVRGELFLLPLLPQRFGGEPHGSLKNQK